MPFLPLTPTMLISGQLTLDDFPDAAAMGVKLIINNRPDGEDPGQLTAAEGAELAAANGIAYRHIPVTGATLGPAAVTAFREALDGAEGPVLAHCRSGTRSTVLWAMAEVSGGKRSPAEVIRLASEYGYDVSGAVGR